MQRFHMTINPITIKSSTNHHHLLLFPTSLYYPKSNNYDDYDDELQKRSEAHLVGVEIREIGDLKFRSRFYTKIKIRETTT